MNFHRAWSVGLFSMLCAVVAPTIVTAATYRMNVQSVPAAGGKCISVPNGQFVEGMRVFIWDCNAALTKTLDYDDQTQQLKFGANCVEVLGQGNARDAIGVGSCNGAVTQRWSMLPSNNNYQILGVNSLCLNISNGVTADGTPLELAPCASNSAAELWVLLQASDASATQSTPNPSANQSAPVQSAPAQKAAAPNNVQQIANALLLFEQHVTWQSVSNDWAGQRDNWIAAVQAASGPSDVATQLLALEYAMTWQSVDATWHQRRDGWVTDMQSAKSASAVARGLLELEQATLWSAVDGDWRQLRDSWVAGLQSIS